MLLVRCGHASQAFVHSLLWIQCMGKLAVAIVIAGILYSYTMLALYDLFTPHLALLLGRLPDACL